MGHCARCWEGHVDARWRLRRRATFDGGLWLLDYGRLVLVVLCEVLGVGLSLSCISYVWDSLVSEFVWFRR